MNRNSLSEILQSSDAIRDLCVDFFMSFSRFEFALKENGFFRTGKFSEAQADWRRYAEKLGSEYNLDSAAKNLFDAPPHRQEVRDGALVWVPVDVSKERTQLGAVILLVKAIRNNLFHGGKHGQEDWDDRARIQFLLVNGIAVLDSLAELGNIQGDYERRY